MGSGAWSQRCGPWAQELWPVGSGVWSQWCGPWALERGLSGVACGLWSIVSAVVAHGLNCSVACGIFLDQGSNPRSLHRQVDSYPLDHLNLLTFLKKRKGLLCEVLG